MILLAKEFLSDVYITPHWGALTMSQIPRWCGISAPRFTFDVTHSFAATLSYWTIFTTFCLLFCSVWFPHKSKIREISTSALQVHQKGWSERQQKERFSQMDCCDRQTSGHSDRLSGKDGIDLPISLSPPSELIQMLTLSKQVALRGGPGEYPLAECTAVLVGKGENSCKT